MASQGKCRLNDPSDARPSTHEVNPQLEETMRQVRASEARLQAILDSALDPVIATDAFGIICLASRSVETVFGWTAEELVGRNVSMLMPEPHRGQHDRYLASYRQTGVPKLLGAARELTAVRKNGEVFPCTVTLRKTDASDLCESVFVGIIRDITEQKRSEQALREQEERWQLAQRLESLGALAGGVAHEFNNLLQAICGFIGLARETLPEDSQPFEDLTRALTAADRAANLTRQMLGFSRQHPLMRENVRPNEVVEELVHLLRPLLGERINVVLSLDDDTAPVLADRTILQQVLMNLCINARDAMPSGGTLTLATANLWVSEASCEQFPDLQPGRYVRFTVTDTGCGMSEEVQRRVFEPFFTTKEVGKGTGLGLAMVYGQVQQHGGVIRLYSQVGEGTTIEFDLPAAATDVVEETPSSDPATLNGTEVILVAEDETIVRDVTVRILERAGYTTLTAQDGEEALRLFTEHGDRVALVLLDSIMPIMTGLEVYEQIRNSGSDVPVVFCTGYDPEADEFNAFASDAPRMIQKPFDCQTLLATIRDAIDRRASCQPETSLS